VSIGGEKKMVSCKCGYNDCKAEVWVEVFDGVSIKFKDAKGREYPDYVVLDANGIVELIRELKRALLSMLDNKW
jgi:hypothetical protein